MQHIASVQFPLSVHIQRNDDDKEMIVAETPPPTVYTEDPDQELSPEVEVLVEGIDTINAAIVEYLSIAGLLLICGEKPDHVKELAVIIRTQTASLQKKYGKKLQRMSPPTPELQA